MSFPFYSRGVPAAVIVTDHSWLQPSQLNVHFLARALARAGWAVTFVTARYGPRAGSKAERFGNFPAGRIVPAPPILAGEDTREIETAVLWHRRPRTVVRRGWAAISGEYSGGIPKTLAGRFRDADLLMFDAGEPLAFYPAVRALNPRARLIFRMSDLPDLHPGSSKAQESFPRLMEDADVVAVPAESMWERYREHPSVRLVPHGLELSVFDRQHASPYSQPGPHAVFVGMGRLDVETLTAAARLRPDITFHVVGPWGGDALAAPNIILHGVLSFENAVPFVTHADIGLHLIKAEEPASFARSLKVVQYSYCRLPVVVPENMLASGANIIAYRNGDEASLRAALEKALQFDRKSFVPDVRSWDDVLADLLSAVGLSLRAFPPAPQP